MDNYCRVCLRSDEFKKVHLTTVSQIGDMRIDDMIVYCTQLEVNTEDSLPQQICIECLAALNSTFVFRKLCYRSDTTLREMLKTAAFEPCLVPVHDSDVPPLVPIDDLTEITIKQDFSEQDECLNAAIMQYEESLAIDANEVLPSQGPEQTEIKKARPKKRFVCESCGYDTPFANNFNRHKKRRRDCALEEHARILRSQRDLLRKKLRFTEVKVYFCEECEYITKKKPNLRRHQQTLHPYSVNDAISDYLEQTVQNIDPVSNNSKACCEPKLEQEPKEADFLSNDADASHGRKETVQNETSLPNELKTAFESNDAIIPDESVLNEFVIKTGKGRIIHVCKKCGYNTSNISNLTRHQKVRQHTHFGKIKMKIPEDKSLDFKRHMASWKQTNFQKHSSRKRAVKEYMCPHCGKMCPSRVSLRRHITRCCRTLRKEKDTEKQASDLDATRTDPSEQDTNTLVAKPDPTSVQKSLNIDIDQTLPQSSGLSSLAQTTQEEITIKQEILELDDCLDSAANEYNESLATDLNEKETTPEDTGAMKIVLAAKPRKTEQPDCAPAKNPVSEIKKIIFLRSMKALSNNPKMRDRKFYYCEVCGYNTAMKGNFTRHQKALLHHSPENDKHSGSKYTVRYYASLLDETERSCDDPNTAQCADSQLNDTHLITEFALENPSAQLRLRKGFYCEDCGYKNYSHGNFIRHQASTKHTKSHIFNGLFTRQREFKPRHKLCPHCGEKCASRETLKRHLRKCIVALQKADMVRTDE
ncbi:zinc finger protein 729-like [Toxorhynchites rutilus septentrionalis]|uniref:zinc finger protein 729-like n=1 Tax=Toxorhynchites rutilus septentrionalis TaxID=329112 RepID=UPI0024784242|nr:zinc finger protein 729-like [Toxorhynchites rutilus septentrionalis]